jgi:Protein of unknown function (DUF2690)
MVRASQPRPARGTNDRVRTLRGGTHVKRKAIATLAAAVAAAGTAVLVPGTAYAATYDGEDPQFGVHHCGATVSTKRWADVYRGGIPTIQNRIGYVELRYSSACRTVWGRVVIFTEWDHVFAEVHRNSDGAVESCVADNKPDPALGGSYTCYTSMLNDRNVTSYVYGGRATNGEDVTTGSY